jgi:hypothetical protein
MRYRLTRRLKPEGSIEVVLNCARPKSDTFARKLKSATMNKFSPQPLVSGIELFAMTLVEGGAVRLGLNFLNPMKNKANQPHQTIYESNAVQDDPRTAGGTYADNYLTL